MLDLGVAATRLLAFKAGLYDPNAIMVNWQAGSNPCGPMPWFGLVCASGWVVAIRLQDQGLVGPLTADLVQVSHLIELHLANNVLTGKLCVNLMSCVA